MVSPWKESSVLFSLLSFTFTFTCIVECSGEDSHDKCSFTGDHGNIFLTAVPGPHACMFEIVYHKKSFFVLPNTKKCWHMSIIWLCSFFSKHSTFLQCLNSLCRQADTLCGLFVYLFFTLMPTLKWPPLILHLLWSYDSFITHFMVLSFCGYIFSDSCSCCFLYFLMLNILSADIISGAICASQAL